MAFRRDVVLVYKEILSNIVRHAGAHHVAIRIDLHSGKLRLIVSDDGGGFDAAQPSAGNGLATMRRRAQQLGGTVEIEGSPGKGTVVTLEAKIP
jgi:signal transduction histidine kinase